MNIHVLTPFSRPHLLNELLALYGPQKIEWHLLVHDTRPLNYALPIWTTIHRTDDFRDFHIYRKLNWWIKDNRQILDDDRYGVLCDDDGFDPEYFQKIRDAGDAPVVITQCEMGRRKHDPNRSGGILYADQEHMKPGCVGCQFWVKGSVFRNVIFPISESADGEVAVKLAKENETKYLPEASRWYNWLLRDGAVAKPNRRGR